MTRPATRVKDDPAKAAVREERRKSKARRDAVDAQAPFGKPFADLTGAEKDDLLKMLAIRAGLVEE
jgi:hypothetical protein